MFETGLRQTVLAWSGSHWTCQLKCLHPYIASARSPHSSVLSGYGAKYA